MLFFDIIKSVLKDIDYKIYPDDVLDIDIKGISCDSRKIFRGYIFAAINGYKCNGSVYIPDAISHGAVTVLTENTSDIVYSESGNIYVIVVENVRKILAEITLKLHFNGNIPLDIFGITGTNGKTSVSFYVSHILNTCNVNTAILGTLGGISGTVNINTDRTTPDIVSTCEIFGNYIRHGVKAVAMEVSSHALELERVHGIKFKIGVFTNLTQDHLDFHSSMESYANAKKKLFSQCNTAIINIDDRYGENMLVPCKKITYSVNDSRADYFAKDISYSSSGTSFILCNSGIEYKLKLPVWGNFTVMNVLAAIALCHEYGLPTERICNALPLLPAVPGRFECISKQNGVNVILDYAHTPDGIKNVLETTKTFTMGNLISVFGCGGDRDNKKRSIMGKIACDMSDYTIITTDNPRSENELTIAHEVASMIEYGSCSYNIILDREKAIQHALNCAKNGDTVIIMGKGHESYQQFGNIRYPFSDKETVLRIQQNKITNKDKTNGSN